MLSYSLTYTSNSVRKSCKYKHLFLLYPILKYNLLFFIDSTFIQM